MPFLTIDGLETLRRQTRDLLLEIRAVADATEEKIKALDRRTFAAGHIQAETQRLRSEAAARATELYHQFELPRRLQDVESSRQAWTTESYLRRLRLPPIPPTAQSQDAVLRQLSARIDRLFWAAATQKMDTAELAATVALAVDTKNFPVLAELAAEVSGRRIASNDPDLAVLATRLKSIEIDDVQNASGTIDEVAKLGAWINSTLRSLTSGSDDVGKRLEQAETINRERQAARDAEATQAAQARAAAVAQRDFGQ